MIYPSLDHLLKKVDSKYTLVVLTARRAREVVAGDRILVNSKSNKAVTIALEEIEACIAAPNTVEAEIEAKELARIIEAFLDTLTTENRVIFMRRYWFSDSYKDIAEFMGLSEKNISVRLTRIREKMKQTLGLQDAATA